MGPRSHVWVRQPSNDPKGGHCPSPTTPPRGISEAYQRGQRMLRAAVEEPVGPAVVQARRSRTARPPGAPPSDGRNAGGGKGAAFRPISSVTRNRRFYLGGDKIGAPPSQNQMHTLPERDTLNLESQGQNKALLQTKPKQSYVKKAWSRAQVPCRL